LIKKIIDNSKPNFIINLVALTNVDLCEKKKDLADKSNNLFVKNLVEIINKKYNIHLIHISTDQVYSGKGNHSEKTTKPRNYYGYSKLLGEKHATKVTSTILRTNFIGKTQNNKNFCNWIYTNLKNKKKINAYKNIFFSPVHTSTLSKLIEKIISKRISGTFNIGAKNRISKANLIEKFAFGLGFDKSLINKINYKRSSLYAKRPYNMSMKVDKFEKKLNFKLPKIENEINKLLLEYK